MALDLKFSSPENKSPATNHAMEIILLIIIGILFFIFILQPKRALLQKQQDSFSQLNAEDQSLVANKKILSDLVTKMKSSPDELAKLDEALPLDYRPSPIYLMLNALSQNSGIAVGNIGITPDTAAISAGDTDVLGNPFGQTRILHIIHISLSLTGTLGQFQTFLQLLQNNARITDITSLSISSSASNSLDFTLTLQTYYYE